ncbi:spore germination protein (amino acid permease) [Bacillus mesophilus]|uniref:GerAB/ArcD/ProY family transporter n=1 Tax=Bacillus mesophilus TaxID=1808955 RepID=A0A6M0QAT2_9BACI|nr:GerAB/ArcD/ProY family transporter [Bacillus mesophilus]MBM7662866.1 spore germination protein (amino acid permease) [Bacillus mesophilus]NEY73456.1 GerAB/ArcD/ProY family transporter [Bacillus mesophilus]
MKERLNPFQASVLIYMIQSGVMLFSLPRLTAETFGTNGWIGIIIVWLIANINIYIIWLVFKLGKERSVFEIFTRIPKIFMTPLYLLIVVVWIGLGTLVMLKFIMLTKMLFFPFLHNMVLMIISLLLSYMLIKGGIYHISKATVVLFFFTVWTTLLLFLHLKEFSFTRLSPFIFQGEKDLIKGGINIYSSLLGYELSLLFVHLIAKKRLFSLLMGNCITSFIYVSICIVSFGFFSFGQLTQEMYPLIALLEYIKFPVLERVENFIFSLFGLKVLITLVMYLWGAKEIMDHTLPKLKQTYMMIGIILISFSMSLYPSIMREVDMLLEYLTYAGIAIAFLLPILALTVVGFEKLLKKEYSKNG